MPSSVRIGDKERWVEVVHHGLVTIEELKDVRRTAAEMMVKANLSRVLVDGRDADIAALATMDTYEFNASHASTLPFAGRLRIAVVVAPGHREKSGFGEDVARNRGVNLRTFLDADNARRWLAEKS